MFPMGNIVQHWTIAQNEEGVWLEPTGTKILFHFLRIYPPSLLPPTLPMSTCPDCKVFCVIRIFLVFAFYVVIWIVIWESDCVRNCDNTRCVPSSANCDLRCDGDQDALQCPPTPPVPSPQLNNRHFTGSHTYPLNSKALPGWETWTTGTELAWSVLLWCVSSHTVPSEVLSFAYFKCAFAEHKTIVESAMLISQI